MRLSAARRMWDTPPLSVRQQPSHFIRKPPLRPLRTIFSPLTLDVYITCTSLQSEKVLLSSIKRLSEGQHSLSQLLSPVTGCQEPVVRTHLSLWQCGRTWQSSLVRDIHCTVQLLDSLTVFLSPSRDLIKKFLVIDRARRLGNMKVSWLDFLAPWTTWQPNIFHTFSR